MIEVPTTSLPEPVAIDAAIQQWDEVLRALYLAELAQQHGALPN